MEVQKPHFNANPSTLYCLCNHVKLQKSLCATSFYSERQTTNTMATFAYYFTTQAGGRTIHDLRETPQDDYSFAKSIIEANPPCEGLTVTLIDA